MRWRLFWRKKPKATHVTASELAAKLSLIITKASEQISYFVVSYVGQGEFILDWDHLTSQQSKRFCVGIDEEERTFWYQTITLEAYHSHF